MNFDQFTVLASLKINDQIFLKFSDINIIYTDVIIQ